jgi:hypothetical protein
MNPRRWRWVSRIINLRKQSKNRTLSCNSDTTSFVSFFAHFIYYMASFAIFKIIFVFWQSQSSSITIGHQTCNNKHKYFDN